MKFGRRWKTDTLKNCGLTGARRMVFSALVLVGDFKGRSRRPYRELATIAGVCARSCVASLAHLTQAGFILLRERGTSHRPAMFQVVPYEKATEPALVQPDCTEDFSSLVQTSYVAPSVNP